MLVLQFIHSSWFGVCMPNLTISDIARMAGVGKSTVSRYLNDTGYVGSETRKKIERVIESSGYVPSAVAQDLSRQVSGTVGLIIPEADNPFFSAVLNGVTDIVDEKKLTLLLCNTNNSAEKDLRSLQLMQRQRVSGLIFTPAIEYGDSSLAQEVKRQIKVLNCPVVVFDRLIDELDCDTILSDNYGGAYAATKALIQAGHRRVGTVAGDLSLDIARERLRGFQQAVIDFGLPLNDAHIIHGEFDVEKTYVRTKDFLQSGDLPTGVFVSNNLGSYGFLKAVYESGMSIPQDISYIGFDDVPGINLFGNKFSFMDRDAVGMGRQAMKMLVRRMERPALPVERIYLSVTLRLYGSELLFPEN